MKKLTLIFAILFAVLQFPFQASAQERRPDLTPEQKLTIGWVLANALTSFIVGAPVFLYATAMGKQKELCDAMKGVYDPSAKDLCTGGDWVRIIPLLPKPDPRPAA